MRNQQSANFPTNIRLLIFFSIAALLISVGALGYSIVKIPKVAFIDSDKLLDKYKGMQDARSKFEEKAKVWKSNTDTLKVEFEAALKTYERDRVAMSKAAQIQKEKELRSKQEEIGRYSQAVSQQAEQEDKKLTESVLAHVNSFLKVYGEKHGYNIIFGANGAGSVLYGSDLFDITDEVLLELNGVYESN